ncbi:MAG: ricin-type beta-trefoil lectin domain protein [Pseudomonadota bacterium]
MRAALALTLMAAPAFAASPDLQTPSPVIHLADNLDEADRLGWCIDTVGRGFGEQIHAHSCKPRGGDVQFSYSAEKTEIRSVAFPDYCMAVQAGGARTFGLVACDETAPEQRFTYDALHGAITPTQTPSTCVVVGTASRSAGPFLSRDLLLADCDASPPERRTWVVVP